MAIYTVHVPPGDDAFDRAERTAFVRDGFSLWAFLFGPLYLLRCRAWIAAALWVILVLSGAWLCQVVHLPWGGRAALTLLVALFTGLEANSLHRAALHQRGFVPVDVVAGVSRRTVEQAFFTAAAAGGLPAPPPPAGRRSRSLDPGGPVIGSFETGL